MLAWSYNRKVTWFALSVLVVLILACASLALAQTSTFRLTGTMHTPRFDHSATLLPSGKVLVAGGVDWVTSSILASGELYDPATGTWTPTGSMNTPRKGHTATLLPNGKVLVVGGEASRRALGIDEPPNFLASAELYDPATGTWSLTGSMSTAREIHTATLLPSGKVLIAGGRPERFVHHTASAELYDPATGMFTPTGSLNQARGNHTATLLLTGKVLVAGGGTTDFNLSSAELYDPDTGTWAFTGSLHSVRGKTNQAVRLGDGRVLVAGGEGSVQGVILQTAELYDPVTGTFSVTGSLNIARLAHTLTLLSDGKVLATGGISAAGVVFASAELYDSMTQTWSATASMNVARYFHTTTALPSGEVLVAGGFGGTNSLASAELFGFAEVLCPAIAATKTATAAVHIGDAISVTAHVTNTGNTGLTVTVTDDKAGPLIGSATLGPGAAADYTGSYLAPAAGATSTNTVIATGVDTLGRTVTASASFTTTILHPATAVTKTATPFVHVGDPISVTAHATNTGDT